MKTIIFDNDVPDSLIKEFPSDRYSVLLCRKLQPPAVSNGALLQRAVDEGAAAMVTADRNMEFQHPRRRYGKSQRADGRLYAPLPVFVLRSVRQKRDEYAAQIRDFVLPALNSAELEGVFYHCEENLESLMRTRRAASAATRGAKPGDEGQ